MRVVNVGSLVRATIPNAEVWALEPQKAEFYAQGTNTPPALSVRYVCTFTDGTTSVFAASYAFNNARRVNISLNDLTRLKGLKGLRIEMKANTQTASADITILGGAAPWRGRPLTESIAKFATQTAGNIEQEVILPPAYVITPQEGEYINLPYYGLHNENQDIMFYDNIAQFSQDVEASGNGALFLEMDAPPSSIVLQDDEGTQFATIFLRPRDCRKQYAFVNFLTQWGQECETFWELQKYNIKVGERIELQTSDFTKNFAEARGRTDSVVIALTDLTQYDLWYYSQIVTSPLVLFEYYTGDASAKAVQVAVESTDVSIMSGADEGTFYKLEVTLKIVNYEPYN